jgi:hypothetical protein
MYLILSRQNTFEHEIVGEAETIKKAREIVRERIEQCGKYVDRLHPEAFKIVKLVEVAGCP